VVLSFTDSSITCDGSATIYLNGYTGSQSPHIINKSKIEAEGSSIKWAMNLVWCTRHRGRLCYCENHRGDNTYTVLKREFFEQVLYANYHCLEEDLPVMHPISRKCKISLNSLFEKFQTRDINKVGPKPNPAENELEAVRSLMSDSMLIS
jgi:hypothetical protein